MLRTRHAPEGPTKTIELSFGSGVEFKNDSEERELGFPFWVGYRPIEPLKIVLQCSYEVITSKDPTAVKSASGLGDLETELELTFLAERRYRPAFASKLVVKWPTATNPNLGTGLPDGTIGLIVSKEIVINEYLKWGMDFNVDYTRVGVPKGADLKADVVELAFAIEYHACRYCDIKAEVLYNIGGGGNFRGQLGSIAGIAQPGGGGGGNELEFTLGLAQHFFTHLQLEEGVVLQTDGTWQIVVAWEWDFGAD
jgi:hypothetical protein